MPSQDVITRDNVSMKVNAVLYFRVIDPNRAVVEVQNYLYATSQIAQTTLRSVCGQAQLDELLAERERFNERLQEIIDTQHRAVGHQGDDGRDQAHRPAGDMQRAMARQAEAERLRRAKVINAEGEYQAAARLGEAAAIMETQPMAIQLAHAADAAAGRHREQPHIIVPVPTDLMRALLQRATAA